MSTSVPGGRERSVLAEWNGEALSGAPGDFTNRSTCRRRFCKCCSGVSSDCGAAADCGGAECGGEGGGGGVVLLCGRGHDGDGAGGAGGGEGFAARGGRRGG